MMVYVSIFFKQGKKQARLEREVMIFSDALLGDDAVDIFPFVSLFNSWLFYVNWWFGLLGSPYERDCYLGASLESQTTNPRPLKVYNSWEDFQTSSGRGEKNIYIYI